MPTIKPFRDYSEHEVINLFAYETAVANKGTFVKITGAAGWTSSQELEYHAVGATYPNTQSPRYAVTARVGWTVSGEAPIGMLLKDVREVDENGEKLIFNPRKAAEMGVCISGQAVPILKRGTVLYSGINRLILAGTGAITPGSILYTAASGELSTIGDAGTEAAVALGTRDSEGCVLIEVKL